MDDAGTEAELRPVLRAARPAGRRVRRFDAEGPGDADHQRHQDRRLRIDADHAASACRLRRRGIRRRCLLSGQVRDPDGAPAAPAARRRERLDRRHDRRLDHSGRAGRRSADRPADRDDVARLQPALHRHRNRHAARSRDQRDHAVLRHRGGLQLVHPEHRRRSSDGEPQSHVPDRRILALRLAPVARQAGSGVARHDDAVLGRGGHAAVHI